MFDDLIQRLEAATEGSRELSDAVLLACGWVRRAWSDETSMFDPNGRWSAGCDAYFADCRAVTPCDEALAEMARREVEDDGEEWDGKPLDFHDWLDRIGWEIPSPTESLDAALTLLPEGCAVTDLMIWPGNPSGVTILGTHEHKGGRWHQSRDGKWKAKAATPALALCAAILKARASQAGAPERPLP